MSQRINTRIKDEHATQLGLTLTKSKQYRISQEQYDTLQQLRNGFDAYCDEVGINKDDVSMYWDKKSNDFSILVKPNKNKLSEEEFTDLLAEKLKNHSPRYDKLPHLTSKTNNLLVIDIADAHFGKLSSSYETGESYNINIAKQRCLDGVNGIVSKGRAFGI